MSQWLIESYTSSYSLELRQGTGEKQEQQPNGAGEGEGNQGWKENIL